MVMLGVTNQEFLQHNSNRSYPLSERATKQPIIGADDFVIPDNFLVAARLVVNATPDVINVSNFYIGRLILYNGGALIEINYESEAGGILVGKVIASYSDDYNTTYNIQGLISSEFSYGLSGHITIGTFDQVQVCLGDYTFDLAGGRFDPDVVQYSTAAVTSITIISNRQQSAPIYGDIQLIAGDNITLQAVQATNQPTEIYIARQLNEIELPNYIKTINSIKPSEDGNITIASATDCLKITEESNDIVISETCSTPCCGCEELAAIVSNVEALMQAQTNMQIFQQALEQQLNHLITNLAISGV
jgi:hypothetical protein